MKSILLVLSASRFSEKAIDFAVREAKNQTARLVALYVLETDHAKELFDTFTDIGFIGDRPSAGVSEAIMREYRQRGYETLGKVQIKAMEAGVDFEPLMEQGDMTSMILDTVRTHEVEMVVLVRQRKTPLARYFTRSVVDEVAERVDCKVEVFEGE